MWWKYYILMYISGNMRPVETISERMGVIIKEKDEVGEFQNDRL
jgi:hypothetical protein